MFELGESRFDVKRSEVCVLMDRDHDCIQRLCTICVHVIERLMETLKNSIGVSLTLKIFQEREEVSLQELKSGRAKWIEERRELEEKHHLSLSELKRKLSEEKIRLEELRGQMETQKREFNEEIAVMSERVEVTEQEYERLCEEIEIMRQRENEEEEGRLTENIESQLLEKNEEIGKLRDEIEVGRQL